MTTLQSIDPSTGVLRAEFETHSRQEAAGIIDRVGTAQRSWAAADLTDRLAGIDRFGRVLREHGDQYAELMAQEMGKPVRQGRTEIEKCALACDYYVEHAAAHLADEPLASDATTSGVRHRPLGVVLAIMPWNYPFWQFLRVAVPALCAGNALVLKHASNIPESALAIEAAFVEAGLPEDLVRTVLVPGSEALGLIGHPVVAGVSLTGSESVGRMVGAEAGRALKPAVLELGGSDPFVVLADVDIPAVARAAAEARTVNSGQSCIAAKRFLVERSILDEFTAAFAAAMESLAVGSPLDASTDVGPQARTDLRDEVHEQVVRSVDGGATLVTGGRVPDGPGAFYPPTVLAGAGPGIASFEEEVFGPVASVYQFDQDDEAVALANRSPYGLGASVWGRDEARLASIGDRLEAGMVFTNGIVKSDPRLPFGGVKASGYGRELGRHGLLAFTNAQTTWSR